MRPACRVELQRQRARPAMSRVTEPQSSILCSPRGSIGCVLATCVAGSSATRQKPSAVWTMPATRARPPRANSDGPYAGVSGGHGLSAVTRDGAPWCGSMRYRWVTCVVNSRLPSLTQAWPRTSAMKLRETWPSTDPTATRRVAPAAASYGIST